MKKLSFIGGLILLLSGVGSCLKVSAAESAPTQDATFLALGMTNPPAGRFAMFCLSNSTAVHFACSPQAIELAGTNGWRRMSLTGKALGLTRKWIGIPEELKPGEAITFMVPPPVTNGTWRLIFMCQEQKLLIDPVTDVVKHLTDTNAANHQLRQFSGRRYFLRTPDVGS